MKRDIDYMLSVMQAYKEGKTIENKFRHSPSVWYIDYSPVWNWDRMDYRVKEEENENAIIATEVLLGHDLCTPQYFKAAENRLENTSMQLTLFAEQKKTKQSSVVSTELKPIIKWPGGKEKELPHIKLHAPQRFESYYEPFVGGALYSLHLMPNICISTTNQVNLLHYIDTYPIKIRVSFCG